MSRKRGFALAETQLASFDRSTTARCHVQRPDRYRLLEALPADARRITRGGGVSFVGASFAHDSVVQEMGAFDRLLEFDPEQRRQGRGRCAHRRRDPLRLVAGLDVAGGSGPSTRQHRRLHRRRRARQESGA